MAYFFIFIQNTIAINQEGIRRTLLFTGRIRNDAFYYEFENESEFSDIMELQIIPQLKKENWRFYSDYRFYNYYGDIAKSSDELDYAKQYRAFFRLTPSFGIITVGQTYVNFGIPGMLNPFEMNKEIDLSDLDYDKRGISALILDKSVKDLSLLRIYYSPSFYNKFGFSYQTNRKGFEWGTVCNHKGRDNNVAGIHLKADIEIGLHSSIAVHFNDDFENEFIESSMGMDYSFRKLFFGLTLYYNEEGASDKEEYNEIVNTDTYFIARNYLYFNCSLVPDEFTNLSLDVFGNTIDTSGMYILGFEYVLLTCLSFAVQTAYISGRGMDEFSKDIYKTDFIYILRGELKF